ncbi:MAG: type II toxin-antitoxin system VapC family toxin [Nitrospira sp.]|nr:type II toxin-antitoxin system VapC family toxin [Nitrospira sp.]
MPLPKTKFAVLDTSVYIENFRTGRFALRILQSRWIPRCSSVVLHELLRGARTNLEHRFVRDLQRRCQVLTPTENQWLHAAEVLALIRKGEHCDPRKIRELLPDVLIALTARSLGATLITCNESDFRVIRRQVAFHIEYWR